MNKGKRRKGWIWGKVAVGWGSFLWIWRREEGVDKGKEWMMKG